MPLVLALSAVALLGAIGVATQALNGQVGRGIGALRGTCLFLTVGAILSLAIIAASGDLPAFARLPGLPPWLLLPGLVNITFIFTMIHVVNSVGALMTTSVIFFGNMVLSAVLDHVGFVGLTRIPLDASRLAALAIFGAGIALLVYAQQAAARQVTSGPATGVPRPLAVLLAFLLGCGIATATSLNVVLGAEVGTMVSTFMFLAPGALGLLLWFGLRDARGSGSTRAALPRIRAAWLLPGALNVAGIAGGILVVPHVGLQLYTSVSFASAALTGLVMDRLGAFGLTPSPPNRARLLATALLVGGVFVLV